MTTFPLFLAAVRARVDEAGARWLDHAVSLAGAGGDILPRAYTAAPKHVGRAPLGLDATERRALAAVAPHLTVDRWTTDDAARCVLLLAAADRLDSDAFVRVAIHCYENGDAREQQSWLRAVSLLSDPDRFMAVAIDACRTNIVPLFESIACENPYPAQHFPERNFNQLVLKALFNSVPLARIVGLDTRRNPELARMAGDYAAERRAAGRSVPADIALATEDGRAAEEITG
ncbi:MAG: hypothetical protein A3F69_00080 [Acidobacteria bacterium RIFCSPLOWO2_12_FULL_66_10]|nr:MAG: hypothetical protein A3F69_00080 [Acidobacteria bacterium RIFCSPLOWO2_12_FULL_66_10]